MIIQTIKKIDNTLFDKKFANKYLTDNRTLRIGNIISALCPVELTDNDITLKGDQCINFMVELPEISNYAGICFQQLFLTHVANVLSNKNYTNGDIEIVNSDIIIKKEHTHCGIHQLDGIVSLNSIKNINGAILIYLGLYNKAGENAIPRSFSLNFDKEVCYKFMDTVNESFYHLANNIFLKTAKM